MAYLALRRRHPEDAVVRRRCVLGAVAAEIQRLDAVEALPHVRLDSPWVARLRQDLEQLIVRQEVEAREGHALLLQVVLQRVLAQRERISKTCRRLIDQ